MSVDSVLIFIFLGLPAIIVYVVILKDYAAQTSLIQKKLIKNNNCIRRIPFLAEYDVEPDGFKNGDEVKKLTPDTSGYRLFSKLSEVVSSKILSPEYAYNKRFRNIFAEENDEYIMYIGELFYQYDEALPTDSNLKHDKSKNAVRLPVEAGPVRHSSDTHKNLYSNKMIAIIKPKYKFEVPDFILRQKKKSKLTIDNGIPVKTGKFSFVNYYLNGKDEQAVKDFLFDKPVFERLKKNLGSEMCYEVYNGFFIVDYSEVTPKARELIQNDAQYMFCDCFDKKLLTKYELKKPKTGKFAFFS